MLSGIPPSFLFPLLLLGVFIINAIPAFMPPTWLVLAAFHLAFGGNILLLAFTGAIFSTLGRFVLATWSGPVLNRFFNQHMRENASFAREKLGKKPATSFFASFLYALSPFPSNALFMVAGVSRLRLLPIVAGFFLGRLISYSILISVSQFAAQRFLHDFSFGNTTWWLIDLAGIAVTILFFAIDWKKRFDHQKIAD